MARKQTKDKADVFADVDGNRKAMAALIKKCSDGRVKPIVMPMGVFLRGNPPPPKRKKKHRNALDIGPDTIRLWHEEYSQLGQSLGSVAANHGVSRSTVANRFSEYGYNLKQQQKHFGDK